MQANGLELWLYPYRVLPNRTGSEGIIGGIIECVPNSSTRDEIGKTTDCSLKDYFISKFGPPESASFQKAQRNFIVSSAAYAVTSYILQVKDRHNGNVRNTTAHTGDGDGGDNARWTPGDMRTV